MISVKCILEQLSERDTKNNVAVAIKYSHKRRGPLEPSVSKELHSPNLPPPHEVRQSEQSIGAIQAENRDCVHQTVLLRLQHIKRRIRDVQALRRKHAARVEEKHLAAIRVVPVDNPELLAPAIDRRQATAKVLLDALFVRPDAIPLAWAWLPWALGGGNRGGLTVSSFIRSGEWRARQNEAANAVLEACAFNGQTYGTWTARIFFAEMPCILHLADQKAYAWELK
jgi:hypothetical protein